MSLVTSATCAHVSHPVATSTEPAAPERDVIETWLSLEPDGLVRAAAHAYGARLGGTAITADDWADFADTWIEAMAVWDEPLERARLAEALAGILEAVEPPGRLAGPRAAYLVARIFARWATPPEHPVDRASALSSMLDLVDAVVHACGRADIEPAGLRLLLAAVEPPPHGLDLYDARRWMDDSDLSHFTSTVAAGVGGADTDPALRHELVNHALADWRTAQAVDSQLRELVAALGGAHLSDAVRLELLDRLLREVGEGRQGLDHCFWLVGGEQPHLVEHNLAHVLRAAGPLLQEGGARLIRALALTGDNPGPAPRVLACALALAADGWPRMLTIELGCALGLALRVVAMGEAQFAAWLAVNAPGEDGPGEAGSREALILGLRAARDPMLLWEAPGLTPADRLALLARIYGQDRLLSAPLALRCFARTLEAEATPAQRRTLLLALFACAGRILPPVACSQARLMLSREMADMDEADRQLSLEAIATIMRTWVGRTLPLRMAPGGHPRSRNLRDETLAWHERVRLELAGPPGTLEHPEVAARLEPELRDLMEQLAQALTRWERVPVALPLAIGDLEAEEI